MTRGQTRIAQIHRRSPSGQGVEEGLVCPRYISSEAIVP